MEVLKERFGQIGSQSVYSFTLKNDEEMEVTVINYGCIITRINVPDADGMIENIVLGHDTLDEYVNDPYFLGAVVGRVAGRIKGGSFELEGQSFTLAQNDNTNHLHGGLKGFGKVVWDAKVMEDGVLFSYLSRDGEEGYPGNLYIEVTYRLTNDNELSIHYRAQSDQKTLLTATNHSYFNLSGNLKRDVLNHSLHLKSSRVLELDKEFLPTGRIMEVNDTPFDFTKGGTVKRGAESDYPQNVLVGQGYDHPYILDKNHDHEIVLKDPESGRTLTVESDEPAVVVYSGNSLKAEGDFRGVPSRKYLGICLETQAYPDSIHHPNFPSMVLEKGEMYSSVTRYKFGIED
ncbi:aldose epimerase family protein [Mesobacillus subterraneus]|uniref:Aldose 1-epimerase n=1 Tax=Mesobacillus subterraneus TaxID=285983 RepID=A0A3R9E9N5_9BACI|nr:aldose epimerase family protein [Mesobacillus subterraneus]RSD27044.1 galactose mutarotase [Mesobacillus subterraneus]